MFKIDKLHCNESCLNHANDNEMFFILLGYDVATTETDEQIKEALRCADYMNKIKTI